MHQDDRLAPPTHRAGDGAYEVVAGHLGQCGGDENDEDRIGLVAAGDAVEAGVELLLVRRRAGGVGCRG